jgi:hypothetical protein
MFPKNGLKKWNDDVSFYYLSVYLVLCKYFEISVIFFRRGPRHHHGARLHFFQLSKRGGELFCEHPGDRVKTSGEAVLYVYAKFLLPAC